MPSVLVRTKEYVHKVWPRQTAVMFSAEAYLQQEIPKAVRAVVERYEHASLDAKADREALIKALVEALT